MTAPRLEVVVVFLTAAGFFPAITFFGGAALARELEALAAGALAAAAFLAVAAVLAVPPDDLAAAEVAVVLGLATGFFAVVALVLAVLADFGFADTLGFASGLF